MTLTCMLGRVHSNNRKKYVKAMRGNEIWGLENKPQCFVRSETRRWPKHPGMDYRGQATWQDDMEDCSDKKMTDERKQDSLC